MNLSDFHKFGFIRAVACAPEVKLANPAENARIIADIIRAKADADIILFPELSITGYTCADLFQQDILLLEAEKALFEIANATADSPALSIVGLPLRHKGQLLNCAAFLYLGKVVALTPKSFIPNYGEYYERRWFASGADCDDTTIDLLGHTVPLLRHPLIATAHGTVAAEICEDLWVPVPPSSLAAMAGADIIVNLSASNDTIGKARYRRQLIAQQSARCRCAYIYASAGSGESSTDLCFSGYTAIACDGRIYAESSPFQEAPVEATADINLHLLHHDRTHFNTFCDSPLATQARRESTIVTLPASTNAIDADSCRTLQGFPLERHPFVPADPVHKDENCTEIVEIQCHALRQRLNAIGRPKVVVGVSGGLDSTLALLIAVRTFDKMGLDRKGIIGITMPGLATTSHTRDNAWNLMTMLGITTIEIPIGAAVAQHFSDIAQDPHKHDAAFENSQARERTQILMDYANKVGGIVLGTGDLSELALGWCTYNGDHMSMYGINASVPKTLVRHLVEWFAEREPNPEISRTLVDIVATPISPELIPADEKSDEIAQKTEDLVGPYELHDFFLYYMLRFGMHPYAIRALANEAFRGHYDEETILKWLRTFYRRFFNQQFKRSAMPDGPKVGSVCLSPRGDWRMPSDASARIWLDAIDGM